MTTPFNPKNPNKTSILTRAGVPEYTKLHADAFPTPPAADIGVELEVTDTGDRFSWTGSSWVQTVEQGARMVNVDEVADIAVDIPLNLNGTATTLTATATAGTNTISVTSTAGISIGTSLKIFNTIQTAAELKFPTVLAIAGLDLTLDHPLDNSFAAGDFVLPTAITMNVLGTLASPVIFKVGPPALPVEYHVVRILVTMTDNTAGDMGTFGGMAALTNGIVFRVRRGGQFITLGVWRRNEDLTSSLFNVNFDSRAGGGGTYGVSASLDLAALRAVIALDGVAGDRLEILVQDNLTGLLSLKVIAQGHKV